MTAEASAALIAATTPPQCLPDSSPPCRTPPRMPALGGPGRAAWCPEAISDSALSDSDSSLSESPKAPDTDHSSPDSPCSIPDSPRPSRTLSDSPKAPVSPGSTPEEPAGPGEPTRRAGARPSLGPPGPTFAFGLASPKGRTSEGEPNGSDAVCRAPSLSRETGVLKSPGLPKRPGVPKSPGVTLSPKGPEVPKSPGVTRSFPNE
mmetsp:Transcript_45802/g.105691  ORF Transcript_45802/g.105691 Transcript_45802/m.105691 type:complete len:205 (+) Transcript_45802:471-1085(+)